MQLHRPISLLAALAGWMMLGSLPLHADDAPLAPAERVQLQAKLRSPQLAVRLEAIHRIGQFSGVEIAKLLVDAGLRDPHDDVQRLAFAALTHLNGDPAVVEFWRQRLIREAQAAQPAPESLLLLHLLLGDERASARSAAREFVDTKYITTRHGRYVLLALIDQLGERNVKTGVVALQNLAATRSAESFVVRRALVTALTKIDAVPAVAALIELLPQLHGEVRIDALEYLTLVTDQKLTDSGQWSQWWAQHGASFQFPWPLIRPKGRTFAVAALASGDASYYGMPIYARRVVFVLDASTSMSGQRLATAQAELARAIQRLPVDTHFGIVIFNSESWAWRPQLVAAEAAQKAAALQFMMRVVAQNNTGTDAALHQALQFDAEAIYLLTDGVPTTGRRTEPDDIVATITRQNRLQRASIYTLGVGVDPIGGKFDQFLASLAQENQGAYRRLD